MSANSIADRLREFGERAHGNMTQFAKALGMSPQALSPYLNGRRNPGNRMLKKLENLGCDAGWLLGSGAGIKTGDNTSARKARQTGTGRIKTPAGSTTTIANSEERETLRYLKKIGLDTVDKLEAFFAKIVSLADEDTVKKQRRVAGARKQSRAAAKVPQSAPTARKATAKRKASGAKQKSAAQKAKAKPGARSSNKKSTRAKRAQSSSGGTTTRAKTARQRVTKGGSRTRKR